MRSDRWPAARAVTARAENTLAALAATGIIVLPLAEIALREALGQGIPGSGRITQHLTLWVGMLGAAIAARDGKLIALATGTFLPEGFWRQTAQILAAAVGAAIATVFAFGGKALIDLYRSTEAVLAVGLPTWLVLLVLPVTFGLIAIRLVWRASLTWLGRGLAALGIIVGLWAGWNLDSIAGQPAWPFVVVILVGAVLGTPIFAVLGGLALVLFLVQGSLPVVLLIKAHEQLTSEMIAAIPLFTLAGFLLAAGHASERLLRLFRAFFGWMPGGTAIVTAVVCAFFTTFTGGSGVTILALGGLLLPTLLADGYRERFSLGLITAAGSLGLLLPPALPLMLYGIVATTISLEDLFIAGLVPGLLLITVVAAWGMREGMISGGRRRPFRTAEAAAALWNAKWEILLPVLVLTSLLSGYATPVESAALAALYALIVQRFIRRDLPSSRAVVRVMGDCIALVGGVLLILAVAVGLTNYLVDAEVPAQMIEWTQDHIRSKAMFLLALNGFLLLVGCLMDIFSAIIVVVPLIIPIADVFGVHPAHLGIIFVANLELGYLTPPVGLNLLFASYLFKRPILEVARATFPMLVILTIAVLLITYVPWFTLGLLHWMGRG